MTTLSSYGFAIAGGQALRALGVVERDSEDLDASTDGEPIPDEAVDRLIHALKQDRIETRADKATPDFVRLIVTSGKRSFKIELARDRRLHPVTDTILGPVVSLPDMAAAKVVAAMNRNEPRDLADLFDLSKHVLPADMLRLAKEYDSGVSEAYLDESVSRTLSLSDAKWAESGLAIRRRDVEQFFRRWLGSQRRRASVERSILDALSVASTLTLSQPTGLCGKPTSSGRPCRNLRGSCPHHR